MPGPTATSIRRPRTAGRSTTMAPGTPFRSRRRISSPRPKAPTPARLAARIGIREQHPPRRPPDSPDPVTPPVQRPAVETRLRDEVRAGSISWSRTARRAGAAFNGSRSSIRCARVPVTAVVLAEAGLPEDFAVSVDEAAFSVNPCESRCGKMSETWRVIRRIAHEPPQGLIRAFRPPARTPSHE